MANRQFNRDNQGQRPNADEASPQEQRPDKGAVGRSWNSDKGPVGESWSNSDRGPVGESWNNLYADSEPEVLQHNTDAEQPSR